MQLGNSLKEVPAMGKTHFSSREFLQTNTTTAAAAVLYLLPKKRGLLFR
jgi:hypothetical protein